MREKIPEGQSRIGLALVYEKQGLLEKAEKMTREALRNYQEYPWSEEEDVAEVQATLARIGGS